MPLRLGLDYGGVLFNALTGQPLEGALETLRQIVRSKKYEEIWIVSKPAIFSLRISLFWMNRADFWNITGIPKDHLRYVRQWKDKASVCQQFGITHFVDNRPAVLHRMTTVEHRFVYNPALWEIMLYREELKNMTAVHNWKELGQQLLTS